MLIFKTIQKAIGGLSLSLLFLIGTQALGEYREPIVVWAKAEALMPQWGFYEVGSNEGRAAWSNTGQMLSWVLDIPHEGEYHVWVRKSVGRVPEVRLNDKPLSGARRGTSGSGVNDYQWHYKGFVQASPGTCHLDLFTGDGHTRLAAILLSTRSDFDPTNRKLPIPEATVVTRAPRLYRDDSHLVPLAGDRPFVTGVGLPLYEEIFNDWLPQEEQVDQPVKLWGSANQYICGTFGIRALADIDNMTVTLSSLTGPDASKVGSGDIDIRIVHLRERGISLYGWSEKMGMAAELLLRDNRTGIPPSGDQGGFGGGTCTLEIPAGQSRQIWLTIHIPDGHAPGKYRGELEIKLGGLLQQLLPVEVEVLPMPLEDVEGYYSIYHRFDPRPDREGHIHWVAEERYLEELKDMKRHGLNAASLYGGFDTIDLPKIAGLMQKPVIIPWPGRHAPDEIQTAIEMGYPGLLYHGVDEPGSPESITRSLNELERRHQAGIESLMAISDSIEASEALRSLLEYPVLNMLVHGIGNRYPDHVIYANEAGFTPISYWMTSTHFPLWFRVMTGLYNTAAGFHGSMPWAYSDHVDLLRKFDPYNTSHQVTYPDASGKPIPTLQWAAHRAGIDDVRYLQALERSIARATDVVRKGNAPNGLAEALAKAEIVHRKKFKSIGGRWIENTMSASMDELEKTRRVFADATVAIHKLIR